MHARHGAEINEDNVFSQGKPLYSFFISSHCAHETLLWIHRHSLLEDSPYPLSFSAFPLRAALTQYVLFSSETVSGSGSGGNSHS